eukprot:CAMPEP_0118941606 /NCGR_PEP_ID=MMETSP1169-20130426/34261_1 /TAXON_ID=36882 /ORGANISM="Pyramimonas obovata, Strain CCMP722" /LENGTH=126 /DNA_ID=CAMNT_0006886405 /DNA_START=9 /DNA_END=385 /DNA_ORIENTATION=+
MDTMEQIRSAMEAERKAQEQMLLIEQKKMAEKMQAERQELENRLMAEKRELEEKLERKRQKKAEAAANKGDMERQIAETLKMFQMQLQMQHEQLQSVRNSQAAQQASAPPLSAAPAAGSALALAQR